MLPDEDGYQILAKLRADPACAATPVIMVTAKTSEIDVVKGLDHGADDYLCKPFGIMEFISRVRPCYAAPPLPSPRPPRPRCASGTSCWTTCPAPSGWAACPWS